jgi:hypothetical protein
MKNVTITLDEQTVLWARVHAAQRHMSVSRVIAELLRRRMREARGYDEAMRRFLAKRPVGLGRPDGERAAVRARSGVKMPPRICRRSPAQADADSGAHSELARTPPLP